MLGFVVMFMFCCIAATACCLYRNAVPRPRTGKLVVSLSTSPPFRRSASSLVPSGPPPIPKPPELYDLPENGIGHASRPPRRRRSRAPSTTTARCTWRASGARPSPRTSSTPSRGPASASCSGASTTPTRTRRSPGACSGRRAARGWARARAATTSASRATSTPSKAPTPRRARVASMASRGEGGRESTTNI